MKNMFLWSALILKSAVRTKKSRSCWAKAFLCSPFRCGCTTRSLFDMAQGERVLEPLTAVFRLIYLLTININCITTNQRLHTKLKTDII